MSANQTPAAFITGLFETHLQVRNLERSMEFYDKVLGLELGLKEESRRVAIYWIGGRTKRARLVSGRSRPGSLRRTPGTWSLPSTSLSRLTWPI
jgi:catechol-2,3-dioxygenase